MTTHEVVSSAPMIYTLQEVAEILRVTERTIYNYIHDKKLPAQKVGHNWRITSTDLQAFLDSGKL